MVFKSMQVSVVKKNTQRRFDLITDMIIFLIIIIMFYKIEDFIDFLKGKKGVFVC